MFHQLEEEQEEGLLKFSSDAITSRRQSELSQKSVRSTRSPQKTPKVEKVEKEDKSSKVPPTPTTIVQEFTPEEIKEQEKRDLIELFRQLELEEEEGLLKLPDEKSLSALSMLSKKSTNSRQKTVSRQSTLSAQKGRSESRQSKASASPKENRSRH